MKRKKAASIVIIGCCLITLALISPGKLLYSGLQLRPLPLSESQRISYSKISTLARKIASSAAQVNRDFLNKATQLLTAFSPPTPTDVKVIADLIMSLSVPQLAPVRRNINAILAEMYPTHKGRRVEPRENQEPRLRRYIQSIRETVISLLRHMLTQFRVTFTERASLEDIKPVKPILTSI